MSDKPVLTPYAPVTIPDIQTYRNYLPTAFDTELTMLEKVNKVIQALNALNINVTDLGNKWNEVMDWVMNDGLSQSVVDQLTKWKDDGTLDQIINVTIFNELNDKIDDQITKEAQDIQNLTNTMNEQLATKVNLDDLTFVNVAQYMRDNNLSFTDAMQQLLDQAKNGGYVQIKIPKGTYDTTKELVIWGNTTIEADPQALIRRKHDGYIFLNGVRPQDGGDLTTLYNGYSNITISGGIWDGNGINFPSKASIMHFAHASNFRLIGAVFKDPANSHHVEFNACRDIWIDRCQFLGWCGSTDTFNEAIQLDIAKLNVTTIGADDGTPCQNVHISNCYFGDSKTAGANHIARAIGSHNATIGKKQTNITIENCTFVNTLSWAIRCYNFENVTISNNTFVNCGAGINFRAAITGVDTEDATGNQVGAEPVKNITITGNTFEGGLNAGRAIEIFGEIDTNGRVYGASVIGNTINGEGGIYDAINLHYVQDGVISGNGINGMGGTGINVNAKSRHISVTGNTLTVCPEDGIYVDGVDYISIAGNTILQCGWNGIYVSAGNMINISNNTIGGVNGQNDVDDPRNHIRVVSGANIVAVIGNICRNYSTTHVTGRAIYVTQTCVSTTVTNNIAVGFEIQIPANNQDANGNRVA